ncbi:glucose-1-phosphate cytidylyltransferase [uncultured Roseibium sp.]|uniref:glucose-1-phosphate cytidylyltransferase n=1 Tax=uncultured Roseibium sp. TaxID=1936171 RepID=UPI003217B51C
MQAVILAGGLGTRISEESHLRPKPMIEIGGKPILWHIMKIYAANGIHDFIICLGYRGYMIKEYFANYVLHASDVTIDARSGEIIYHQTTAEPWRVTLVDTGESSMTGGRVRAVRNYLTPDEPFCLTYGDGVADIDIAGEIAFHKEHDKLATLTSVVPPGRYGALEMTGNRVDCFTEKPPGDNGRINGGFFVLDYKVLDYIEGPQTAFESEPLSNLAENGELMAWRHDGFWHPMDTLRDKNHLENLWQSGKAPWKVW